MGASSQQRPPTLLEAVAQTPWGQTRKQGPSHLDETGEPNSSPQDQHGSYSEDGAKLLSSIHRTRDNRSKLKQKMLREEIKRMFDTQMMAQWSTGYLHSWRFLWPSWIQLMYLLWPKVLLHAELWNKNQLRSHFTKLFCGSIQYLSN